MESTKIKTAPRVYNIFSFDVISLFMNVPLIAIAVIGIWHCFERHLQ